MKMWEVGGVYMIYDLPLSVRWIVQSSSSVREALDNLVVGVVCKYSQS